MTLLSTIQLHQYVAIRLPSDNIKVEQILPNTLINLGKYGSFHTNEIVGRPYHLTYEILDRSEVRDGRELRVVKPSELHAEVLLEEAEPDGTDEDGSTSTPNAGAFDENGLPLDTTKSNVNILDNPNIQKMTMAEIEAFKSDENANPKELIARILASHSQLDQKTAFSLAKYTLRKQKKYMKRFTILPMDIATMADWMMSERDFGKVMEIRNEGLGLLGCWANVHAAAPQKDDQTPTCRYLVVDDTGGLVTAAMAERMGILHHHKPQATSQTDDQLNDDEAEEKPAQSDGTKPRKPFTHHLATSNTITLIHSNQQPNLSLLRYFNYDLNTPVLPPNLEPNPHPLHTHLKTLTWLQLLDPAVDTTYQEPPAKTTSEIQALKSNQRSTYHRKRRRWERCRSIVDETRAGNFDALIVASYTQPTSVLHHLVPLLKGGAQIAIYHPSIEPLEELVDAYSTARRTAFLQQPSDEHTQLPSDDFPVDPTLTLGFMLQTARVRKWQVLPGRTHPLMTGRGGAEGYIATATRVLPVKGPVVARGKQRGKKRKVEAASGLDVTVGSVDKDNVANGAEHGDVDGDGDVGMFDAAGLHRDDLLDGKEKRIKIGESLDSDEKAGDQASDDLILVEEQS